MSNSTQSSYATALCGMFEGMVITSPGTQHDLFVIEIEGEGAFDGIRDLLADVVMFGNDAALLKNDAREGNVFSVNALTREQRVEDFEFDGVPWQMVQHDAG
jgi:hypothetical protein